MAHYQSPPIRTDANATHFRGFYCAIRSGINCHMAGINVWLWSRTLYDDCAKCSWQTILFCLFHVACCIVACPQAVVMYWHVKAFKCVLSLSLVLKFRPKMPTWGHRLNALSRNLPMVKPNTWTCVKCMLSNLKSRNTTIWLRNLCATYDVFEPI